MRSIRGRTTRRIIALAQAKFYACEICMPSGDHVDVEDLLRPLRLTKREFARLDEHLTCPGCESHISLIDQAVPYSEGTLSNERRLNNWFQRHTDRFESFQRFLGRSQERPRKHAFGRRIEDAVKRVSVSRVSSSPWFRVIKADNDFNEGKFFRPSLAVGRYNRQGQAAFYLADSPKTGVLELLKEDKMATGDQFWVTTLRLRHDLRIVNLALPFPGTAFTQSFILHGIVLSGATRRNQGAVHVDYAIPQFLADLIRERDADGIEYTSCREYPYRDHVCGTCLVVFKPSLESVVDLADVRKFEWKKCLVDPPFNLPDLDLQQV